MSRPHPADHPFVEDPKDRDRCGYCSWDRSMQPPAPKVGSPETRQGVIGSLAEIIQQWEDEPNLMTVSVNMTMGEWRSIIGEASREAGDVTPKPSILPNSEGPLKV